MDKAGWMLLLVFFFACGNQKASDTAPAPQEEDATFDLTQFSRQFTAATAPYQLVDSSLQQNKDTALLRNKEFLAMIPDTLQEQLFGKNARIKYTPMARINVPDAGTYFVVKGTAGSKKSALLLNFRKNGEFGAAFPFLVLDADRQTTQVSTFDKNASITRTVYRRSDADAMEEGKDVYVYNKETNQYDLIMTDLLDDSDLELINPIDTFSRTYKWAGDYQRGKNNLVSIRDGRRPELVTIFIHIEKNEGTCTGEIKGDAQITGPNTAVYRQPGDPCVLELNFKSSSVTLNEMEGCGARRGRECSFDGNFTRKKEESEKETPAKKKRSAK